MSPASAISRACAIRDADDTISQPSASSASSIIMATVNSSSTISTLTPENSVIPSLFYWNRDFTNYAVRMKGEIEFSIQIALDAAFHQPCAEPATRRRLDGGPSTFLPFQNEHRLCRGHIFEAPGDR